MKLPALITSMLLSAFLVSPAAHAGIYADALAKCAVENSTENDKLNLIKWMFSSLSLHPAVSSLASYSDATRVEFNENMAQTMEDILTITCREETAKAVRYEGEAAVTTAFEVFGQVASRELFSHPAVAAALVDFEKYFDKEKLQEVFGTTE